MSEINLLLLNLIHIKLPINWSEISYNLSAKKRSGSILNKTSIDTVIEEGKTSKTGMFDIQLWFWLLLCFFKADSYFDTRETVVAMTTMEGSGFLRKGSKG